MPERADDIVGQHLRSPTNLGRRRGNGDLHRAGRCGVPANAHRTRRERCKCRSDSRGTRAVRVSAASPAVVRIGIAGDNGAAGIMASPSPHRCFSRKSPLLRAPCDREFAACRSVVGYRRSAPVPGGPNTRSVFLTMVIGGMCAGGVVMNASHLPTLFVFLWAATLPIAMETLNIARIADGSAATA